MEMTLEEMVSWVPLCVNCKGTGYDPGRKRQRDVACAVCGGLRGMFDEMTTSGLKLVDHPVDYAPGSSEKCAALHLRYRYGLPLWDPNDATVRPAEKYAAPLNGDRVFAMRLSERYDNAY